MPYQRMTAGERNKRNLRMWESWVAGKTQIEIGEEYGVSGPAVSVAIRNHIKKAYRPDAEAYVNKHLDRLTRLWEDSDQIDDVEKRIATRLRILEREAKLLGMDGAIKMKVDFDAKVESKVGYSLEASEDALKLLTGLNIKEDDDKRESETD